MISNKYEIPECIANEVKLCISNYSYFKLICNKKCKCKEISDMLIKVCDSDGRINRLYPAEIIKAVDVGIKQAVNEAPVKNRKKISIALRNSIIDRLPRYCLDISKDTLYKYRKIALYYISLNLQLLHIK